MYVLRDASEIV